VLSDGREATLRAPTWHDLDGHVSFVNELVEEGAELYISARVSRDEEADWLGSRLAGIERGGILVALMAEGGGRMVANSEVHVQTPGFSEMGHLGGLGIAVLRNWRRIGLGTSLMNALFELAKEAGFSIVVLDVFATNKIARDLHEKVGFVETGKIPKAVYRNGNYIDLVRMTKEL